jgi:hypothetical protein
VLHALTDSLTEEKAKKATMKLGKGAAYKLSSAKKATVDSIADVQPTPTPTSSSWREENSLVVFDELLGR